MANLEFPVGFHHFGELCVCVHVLAYIKIVEQWFSSYIGVCVCVCVCVRACVYACMRVHVYAIIIIRSPGM